MCSLARRLCLSQVIVSLMPNLCMVRLGDNQGPCHRHATLYTMHVATNLCTIIVLCVALPCLQMDLVVAADNTVQLPIMFNPGKLEAHTRLTVLDDLDLIKMTKSIKDVKGGASSGSGGGGSGQAPKKASASK